MRPLYESVKEEKSVADKMAEDEAIKQLQYLKNRKIGCGDWLINCKDRQAIETILDLYQQEKSNLENLNRQYAKRVEEKIKLKERIKTNYISKDKIKEFIEENTRTGRGYNEYEEGLINENDRIIDKLSKMIEEN